MVDCGGEGRDLVEGAEGEVRDEERYGVYV